MPKLQTALGFQNLPNTTICNIAMNYMTTPKPRWDQFQSLFGNDPALLGLYRAGRGNQVKKKAL